MNLIITDRVQVLRMGYKLFFVASFAIVISVKLLGINGESAEWPNFDGKPPLLFGHGGEKFYLPEHTVGSYKLAALGGADYVEPDIVLTKDRVPVCYHDLALKRSSNVEDHPEFAHLRGNHSVIIDGKNQTIYDDWLIIHFTLEELKTLTVQQQPTGVRLQDFNDLYSIATFQEFLDAIHEISFKIEKPIGLIPEMKHPQFHNTVFNEIDHYMETTILSMLRSNGYQIRSGDVDRCSYSGNFIPCGPIILQNFDKNTVRYLSTVTAPEYVKLMTLVHPDVYLLTPTGFDEIAAFSDYICLWKEYLFLPVEAEIAYKGWDYDPLLVDDLGGFFKPEEFIVEAHRRGARMTLFTIPDSRESSSRGCSIACEPTDKEAEMFYFFRKGIDGMFVENMPESVNMRMKFDYELQLSNITSKIIALN